MGREEGGHKGAKFSGSENLYAQCNSSRTGIAVGHTASLRETVHRCADGGRERIFETSIAWKAVGIGAMLVHNPAMISSTQTFVFSATVSLWPIND